MLVHLLVAFPRLFGSSSIGVIVFWKPWLNLNSYQPWACVAYSLISFFSTNEQNNLSLKLRVALLLKKVWSLVGAYWHLWSGRLSSNVVSPVSHDMNILPWFHCLTNVFILIYCPKVLRTWACENQFVIEYTLLFIGWTIERPFYEVLLRISDTLGIAP